MSSRRCAFTLVELLVVIGIIAVLVGILVPTLAAVRRNARDTVCSTRLKQLAAATVMYLNDHRQYYNKPHMPAFAAPMAMGLELETLQAFAPYLKWPELALSMDLPALPQVAVCNVRYEVELFYTPYPPAAFGNSFWHTGYSYCAGVMDSGSTTVLAIRPQRIADRRGKRRGVLWADTVVLLKTGGVSQGWGYFHFKGSHNVNPAFVTVTDPISYRGRHSAWSDGSVEWIPRGDFSLLDPDADTAATVRIGAPALTLYAYY